MASIAEFIAGPLRGDPLAAQIASRGDIGSKYDSGGVIKGKTSRARDYEIQETPVLFHYQAEIVERVLDIWERGAERVMASLPTGGGKTRTALWLLRRRLTEGYAENVLWVAPSAELIDQAVEALEELWPTIIPAPALRVRVHTLDPVAPKPRRRSGTVTFCTAKLATSRLRDVSAYRPDVLVFDEAHQAAATTYKEILERAHAYYVPKTLGLSATPGRSRDGQTEELASLFGNNLVTAPSLGEDPISKLRENEVLARVERRRIPLPERWDTVRVGPGNRSSLSIDDLALNAERFWATVRTVTEIVKSNRCLVFAASIAHSYALSAALRARSIECAVVTHMEALPEREKKINAFKLGVIDVLINKNILTAGFDDPGLEDIVIASPVRSPIQWEQIVGRVSRGPAVGGTSSARVWELDDHEGLHDRIMASQRFAGVGWRD